MDISRMSPSEIEALYRRRKTLDPATRAAVEQAHAALVNADNAQWMGSSPADLDPVESAATPIEKDPSIQQPAAPVAAVAAPDARVAQLVDAGFSADEAASIADQERAIYGENPAAANSTPADDAARARRVQDLRQREAQQAAFEASYMPLDAPVDMSDIDTVLGRQMLPGGRYEKVRPGPMGPVAPGPGARIAAEEAKLDAAAEKRRKENAAALEARQRWEAENPDEAASRKATAKDNLADYKRERALMRAAARQGVSVDDVAEQAPEQWGSVGWRQPLSALPGQQEQIFTPTGTRKADATKRARGEDSRRAQWRAQTMLAGANPRKNMANAFVMMGDPSLTPDQSRALQYMLPGGALSAQVDARQLDTAIGLAGRAVTAAAANAGGGAAALGQEQLRDQRLEAAGVDAQRFYDKHVGRFGTWDRQKFDRLAKYLSARYRISLADAEAIAAQFGEPAT